MFLHCFLALVSLWQPVCRPERSFQRAVRPAVGALPVVGSATLPRMLARLAREQQDGSAAYQLYARAEWKEQALFDALRPSALAHCPGRFVPVALDDTRLKKTGKRIPTALLAARSALATFPYESATELPFLQASLLLPLRRKRNLKAHAVSVRFVAAPSRHKPGAKATTQEQAPFRKQRQQYNLSQPSVH